jgi:endonuclease VIII
LLDQRSLAGIGNVHKSEALFAERVDPFAPIAALDDATLRGLVGTARAMLLANLGGGPRITTSTVPEEARRLGRSWVYGRAGRPCRRCGSIIASVRHGRHDRTTYWCPECQGAAGEGRESPRGR